jgi:hypothetical protein
MGISRYQLSEIYQSVNLGVGGEGSIEYHINTFTYTITHLCSNTLS